MTASLASTKILLFCFVRSLLWNIQRKFASFSCNTFARTQNHKNQQSTVMILALHTRFCPCRNESYYMLLLASNRQTDIYWMGLWMEFAWRKECPVPPYALRLAPEALSRLLLRGQGKRIQMWHEPTVLLSAPVISTDTLSMLEARALIKVMSKWQPALLYHTCQTGTPYQETLNTTGWES